jgi:hypothetical protein
MIPTTSQEQREQDEAELDHRLAVFTACRQRFTMKSRVHTSTACAIGESEDFLEPRPSLKQVDFEDELQKANAPARSRG